MGVNIGTVNGFASEAHQRIADAPGWKIYTDTIPPMPGGALNSRWLVFEESTRPELAQRKDCVWYLDLSDAESPELLLNEGVPKLRQTLEVEGKTGKAARVRDTLIHSILQGVIGEMAVFVLASNAGTPLEEVPDWQRKLLVTLARLEPRATEEVVAESWLDNWADNAQIGGVLNKVTAAVQRHLNLCHSSQYLADSVEAEVANA